MCNTEKLLKNIALLYSWFILMKQSKYNFIGLVSQ